MIYRLNALMEEAVPKVRFFVEALVWGIRSMNDRS